VFGSLLGAMDVIASQRGAACVSATGVQGEGEVRAPQAFAHFATLRARVRWFSLTVDILLALAAYEIALVFFGVFHHYRVQFFSQSLNAGLPLCIAVILVTFLVLGLYKLEAYVSRPLHFLTVAKGSLIAMVVTAFFSFAFKSPVVNESRLIVATWFLLFFVFDALARVWLLEKLYSADVRGCRGDSIIIGDGSDGSVIASRCRELRGFAPVVTLRPRDKRRNGFDAEAALLGALAAVEPPPRHVFLDCTSLGHKATFDLIAAARARGAEVYLIGRLASPLDSTRLLLRLFEMPVMRVSGEAPRHGRPRAVKRAFDIVASATALVLLAPLFAVVAILVKRDSAGSVFFRQTRIGLHGRSFEFVKFRSMSVDNDDAAYRAHSVGNIVNGAGAGPATDKHGRPLHKYAGDARVTRVGQYLRKYSLDELPQFWNVLKGDMSLIGPRPALDYEVEAYKPWHRLRLDVMPGVSGLWQVSGRSHVGFDEMVFQDVIYAYNQSFLTDVGLCLRTVPAVLSGRGAV